MTGVRTCTTVLALVALVGAGACGSDNAASPSPSTTATSGVDRTIVRDGEPWIVFHGADLGLTLARPDGTGVHTILGGETVHPDWSPDGSEIAYVDADEGGEVWVTDPVGEARRPLVETYPDGLAGLYWDNPAWSRDGARIAMVGYEGNPNEVAPAFSVIAVVDVATGDVTVASELSRADGQLHSFPRWSPDGDALVLNVDHFTGENFDGSTVAVMRTSGDGEWSAPAAITEVDQLGRVDWHPTEDLIVFGIYDLGAHQDTDEPTNLFTITPDGRRRQPVTSFGPGEVRAAQPTWTSDGRIVFAYVTGDRDEDRAVAVIDTDGSNLEILIHPEIVGPDNRPHPRLRPLPTAAG